MNDVPPERNASRKEPNTESVSSVMPLAPLRRVMLSSPITMLLSRSCSLISTAFASMTERIFASSSVTSSASPSYTKPHLPR